MAKLPMYQNFTAHQRKHARVHSVLMMGAFILFWIPVIIFARLAGEVVERQPLPQDITIINAVHAGHTTVLDNFFLFMTALGEPLVVGAVGFVLLGLCIYKKWYRFAIALFGGIGGALVANLVLKYLFARTRPSIFTPLVVETSYSFPSGHAMVSSAFVGIGIILLWRTRLRIPVIVFGIIATFLIGLSRVYLGVHYPSDILAGWSVGLVWAILIGSIVLNRPFGIGRRLSPYIHRLK